MEQSYISSTNLLGFPEAVPPAPFFSPWAEIQSCRNWFGLLGWVALVCMIVAAIITVIRHFAVSKSHGNRTAFYRIAYVCFLTFFGGVGFDHFFGPGPDHGPDPVYVATLVGRTLLNLAIGSGLFLLCTALVSRLIKVPPRLSLLEIGPVAAIVISWGLIAGGMLILTGRLF